MSESVHEVPCSDCGADQPIDPSDRVVRCRDCGAWLEIIRDAEGVRTRSPGVSKAEESQEPEEPQIPAGPEEAALREEIAALQQQWKEESLLLSVPTKGGGRAPPTHISLIFGALVIVMTTGVLFRVPLELGVIGWSIALVLLGFIALLGYGHHLKVREYQQAFDRYTVRLGDLEGKVPAARRNDRARAGDPCPDTDSDA